LCFAEARVLAQSLAMPELLIILLLAGLPLLYFIVQYNALIGLRNHIRDAWSNIDTELNRRYDLIPNLVSVVKGYAAHEKEVLERVIELRNRAQANHGRPSEQAADENQLVGALQRLLVVVENYPALKADEHFLKLQRELINTENRIQAARRFYNGNVRDYRNKCESFPTNLIAQIGGFQPEEFFSVHPSVREVPDVEFSNP
jgi:LemA protein